MSDTSQTESAIQMPSPTPTSTPLPNDAAARSATGEILEPSQIAAQTTSPKTEAESPKAPDSTSTSKDPDSKDSKPDAKGAPETYADFTAPDGYTLDPKTIEAATPIFKELGLTQEQAQRLVQFHSEQMIAAAKAPADTYTAMRTDWVAKAKSDPDMAKAVNGDKTGLDAVRLDLGRALNAINDPALVADFKSAMDLTGAGDNPAFIKTMWKLAQFVTEGKHVAGANPSPHGQRPPNTSERPTAAKSLYPNLPG